MKEDEIIKLNVGGTLFQTQRTTLQTDMECKLSNDDFLKEHYQHIKDEYFFDKNPQIFGAVLNFLRTKELHLPSNVCSAVVGLELEYWGLQTHRIERCCWTRYNEWKSNLSTMIRLEKSRTHQDSSSETKVEGSFWTRYRDAVWRFLNRAPTSVPAKMLEIVSFLLVILSLFSFIVATIEPFKRTSHSESGTTNQTSTPEYELASLSLMSKHPLLNIIDLICLTVFSLEYFTRLIFAPVKRKYLFSLLSMIDLIALIPDYIDGIILLAGSDAQSDVADIRFAGVVRVLRTIRIFRLVRHNTGLWVLMYTLKASLRELVLLVWFVGIGTTLFASLIYLAEEREPFSSIPESCWWALITMTTVGYGDFFPVTLWGKVVGSCCAMSGLLLIGFTVPTLVNNFVMFYSQVKAVKNFEKRTGETCPALTHL